jgi:hypothetical protein
MALYNQMNSVYPSSREYLYIINVLEPDRENMFKYFKTLNQTTLSFILVL